MNNFDGQFIIEQFEYVNKNEEYQSDYENSESEYHQNECKYDGEIFSEGTGNCSANTPAKTEYFVNRPTLVILLKICLTCSLPTTTKNIKVSHLTVILAGNLNLMSIDIQKVT